MVGPLGRGISPSKGRTSWPEWDGNPEPQCLSGGRRVLRQLMFANEPTDNTVFSLLGIHLLPDIQETRMMYVT
jgi:hypothetical protein